MRKLVVVGSLIFVLTAVSGCGSSADSLMKDQIKYTNDLADAYEKKADKAEIDAISKKLEDTKKKFNDLKLSGEEQAEILKKYFLDLMKASARLAQARGAGKLNGGIPKIPGIPGVK